MNSQLFYGNNELVVLVVTSLVLIGAALLGFAVGRVSCRRIVDKSQIGGIQASILGLLALLLGFTFGLASSRYDTRRTLAVDEANALGTTFMRAQMLPEPYRTTISDQLRHYVDLRVNTGYMIRDFGKLTEAKQETEKLQQAIWKQATALAREHDTPITSLFVSSLNDSIDLFSSRAALFMARVPTTILWILACISAAGLGIVGYGFGIVDQRSWLVMALVAILVAAVIVMIVDLDRPESGPTRSYKQSLIDLKNSLPGYEEPNGQGVSAPGTMPK